MDQAKMLRRLVEERQKNENGPKIIAITSGKGGVGKTNFTVNLAIAMAMCGKKILIIDADLGMANVDVILGTTPQYNLLNLLDDNLSLEEIMATGPHDIKYISGGSGLEKLANLNINELEYIIDTIDQCEYVADYIFIDTGAGLNKNVLNFIIAADEVILLTTPEPTAITDAYAIMKAYSYYSKQSLIGVVVNRIFEDNEEELVLSKLSKTAEKFLDLYVKKIGGIYEDRNLIKAVKAQQPVLMAYPNTIASRCIKDIAYNMINDVQLTRYGGLRGFLDKLRRILR